MRPAPKNTMRLLSAIQLLRVEILSIFFLHFPQELLLLFRFKAQFAVQVRAALVGADQRLLAPPAVHGLVVARKQNPGRGQAVPELRPGIYG